MAAAWLILFANDLVIDPVAAGPLLYWRWGEPGRHYGIPAHNFVGWFGVSLLMFGLAGLRRAAERGSIAGYAGLTVALFFTVLALANALAGAAVIGIMLVIIDLFIRFARKWVWRTEKVKPPRRFYARFE